MHWCQVVTLIVSQLFIQQSSVNEVVLVAAKSETKEKVKAIYRHLHPGVDNPG